MYVAIDLGATNTRIGVFTELDQPEMRGEPTRHVNSGNYEQDYDFILNELRGLSGKLAIDAVGIGTPGEANQTLTRIASAVNMRHWQGRPLVEPVQDLLGCPVFYNNDAVNEGLGEAYYGYALEAFHYLIWGSGIGGAELLRTGSKFSAEKLDWTSHFKAWEQDCSGIKIADEFHKGTASFTPEDWKIVLDRYSSHLKRYIETYKPNSVVIGGGLASLNAEMLTRYALPDNVRFSSFGSDTGLYGALGLIRNNINS